MSCQDPKIDSPPRSRTQYALVIGIEAGVKRRISLIATNSLFNRSVRLRDAFRAAAHARSSGIHSRSLLICSHA